MTLPRLIAICGLVALGMTSVEAADDPGGPASPDAKAATFEGQVLPVLSRYCTDCHGKAKPKAGLDLSAFTEESSVARSPKIWEAILDHVEGRIMPPEDRPQPSEAEFDALTGWIQAELQKGQCGGPVDPGRVTIRRLNRAEYANTIRDLIGIEFRMTDDFPSDDVGYGFDNIGDVLSMPPILLEKYMAAAEKIASQAIVTELPWKGTVQAWEAEDLGRAAGAVATRTWGGSWRARARSRPRPPCPTTGRISSGSRRSGSRPARTRRGWRSGSMARRSGKSTSRPSKGAPGDLRGPLRGEGGPPATRLRVPQRLLPGRRPPLEPGPEPRRRRDRGARADRRRTRADLPESHRRIFFRRAHPGDGPTTAPGRSSSGSPAVPIAVPSTAEEVDRLAGFVDLAVKNGDTFELGIQLAVQAVLVSPQFLFRVELDRGDGAEGEAHPIGDYELATRLSYFLWSSMPDEDLFELARRGTLHLPEVLEAQVRRMLADPKADALVENFAGQWLQTRNLKTFSPDRRRFPEFDEALRAAMRAETELFFRVDPRGRRSILDFLDADFTFLNERLAQHYGIDGVEGDEFRRVALTGDQRGGLLTQAAILTLTSNPTRTSPVKRGKWVLEQILGTPPLPRRPTSRS